MELRSCSLPTAPSLSITADDSRVGIRSGEAASFLREPAPELAKTMKDPDTGFCPYETIKRKEDLYHGRMLDKAPDIVFQEGDSRIRGHVRHHFRFGRAFGKRVTGRDPASEPWWAKRARCLGTPWPRRLSNSQ